MTRVLYISTFQFSGSTLLSFLLNTHTKMTTVGHTTGWNFGEDEDFRCSCGEPLDECPFYRAIAEAYSENGLAFDIRDFGTAYRVSRNDRLNRLLTAGIPFVQNSRVELIRDKFVRSMPYLSRKLRRSDAANFVFMSTALKHSNAEVFVDNSHDPYRFRQLSRARGLELLHMHLVRDPRGVACSCKRNSGWNVKLAMKLWLRRQSDILRISSETENSVILHYEDVCDDVTTSLKDIHSFAGVPAQTFSGDFRAQEHHILGNDMRMSASSVKVDNRWQKELSESEIDVVTRMARDFVSRNPRDGVSEIVRRYFQNL